MFVVGVLGACGDEEKRRADTPVRAADARQMGPGKESPLRLIPLASVNASGVTGTARLLLRDGQLSVQAIVRGAETKRPHLQHVHLPSGSEDGRCPTKALDRDGDGVISLQEGSPAYGAPAVSLEPFPTPDAGEFEYMATLDVPRRLALDRGVVVIHGMHVNGKFDPTVPVACGAIAQAWAREVTLEPVNQSGVAGTARLAVADQSLLAWISIAAADRRREHLQHIHIPPGNQQGRCPTAELDRNNDGLISLEEGAPAYGAPAISLEPFPRPDAVRVNYLQALRIPPELELERGVVVLHGMELDGTYVETLPIACAEIEPTSPATDSATPQSPRSASGDDEYDAGQP
jgi:hypothetical protein